MKTAVLIIDMIKDFVTGEFENERAKEIVPNIQEVLEAAREKDKPVIYVTDAHPEGDEEFSIWGEHAKAGTEGSEVIPELEPMEGEPRLDKTKYSAFFETGLDEVLEEKGVIHRHVFDNATARFETSDAPHHDHIIDVETGEVVEFTSPEIERLQREIARARGYEVVMHRHELYCRKKDSG
mgnify:CR=1 FL=1